MNHFGKPLASRMTSGENIRFISVGMVALPRKTRQRPVAVGGNAMRCPVTGTAGKRLSRPVLVTVGWPVRRQSDV